MNQFLLPGSIHVTALHNFSDNIVIRTDPAGNVKPDGEKSTEKINGVVATIMGLGLQSQPQFLPGIGK
ncbi:hypothetical protein G7Y41_07320 [Schaalia sp. ZJ405]|uniref:hypothetical protein n=1 Tax=Schaalia sp. ZJ405 TaxID=2709403 RepID=UPI0013ED9FCD|nr:hypothetical protein [Schaalia sp. ZJ405]QPK82357.1 hypothetical protein G7Y41_07320 [Schaalia sp. ZJ405]